MTVRVYNCVNLKPNKTWSSRQQQHIYIHSIRLSKHIYMLSTNTKYLNVQHPSLSTNDRDICNVSHDRYRRFSQKETYTMHMMNDRPQRRCMHFSEVVLLLLFALNILISFLNSSLAFFSWVDFGIKFGSVPSHRYMAVGLCWMFWDCGSAADPLYRCWGALGLHPFTQRSMCK